MENSAAFCPPTQDEMGRDIAGLFRGAIRLVLECVLNEEVHQLVGARRYERLGSRIWQDRRYLDMSSLVAASTSAQAVA
jgi:hypothetical protein